MMMTAKHACEWRPRPRQRRIFVPMVLLACISVPALAFGAEESKSETIGPWEIEAIFKGDKFDRCSINRKLDDDIVATFVRSSGGLSLELKSPNWQLERGQDYPVTMKLGPLSFDAKLAAEPSSVSMDVTDKKFEAGLRSAKALNVVAAAATIKVPLDKSGDAFDRLAECVEKNDKSVRTNPFVAPARQP
jgi:hypothetical protein